MRYGMESIFVFGASGHAKVVCDILEKEGKYNIAGFIDLPNRIGESFFGYNILGEESDLPRLCEEHGTKKGIVALGFNHLRKKVVNLVLHHMPDFTFVNAIHPNASVARGVRFGKGVMVMAGAVINSDCLIGDHTIVNTKASVDHECVMEAFSTISPGATVGGNVRVGKEVMVSIGASILPGLHVGDKTTVGAGAVVTKDLPEDVIALGIPAVAKEKQ